MDTLIREIDLVIGFEDSFPYPGEVKEIIREDKSEWIVQVLELSNMQWEIENGKAVGVKIDMKVKIIEEIRSSSKGKLRLV